MVELADTLDLGSNGFPVQVQVLLSAPKFDNPNLDPFGTGFGLFLRKNFGDGGFAQHLYFIMVFGQTMSFSD